MPDSDQNGPRAEEIRDKAADWFARMHASDGAADRDALQVWLAADPAHRAAYERLERRWDQTAFLANSEVGRGRDLSKARVRSRGFGIGIAAGIVALALATAVAIGLRNGDGYSAPRGPATVVAEANTGRAPKTVTLPDGSSVTLGAGASIRIAYTPAERRLRLEQGRARFTVARGRSRPFVVDADDGAIVAHGTIFEVAVDHAGVRVVLLRGAVEVRKTAAAGPGGATVRLAPGQEVRYAPAGPISRPARAAAARDRMLDFDGAPLAEAATAMNRVNDRKLRIDGADVASLRISGAYRADDPAGFARDIASAFALAAVATADGDIAIGRAAPP